VPSRQRVTRRSAATGPRRAVEREAVRLASARRHGIHPAR
jgi:hypothetical protein